MNILSELHQDHLNLSRLLEMLDRKVEQLRGGVHPDFSLMAEVVSYVGSYADQHHHPREDKMYAFFQGVMLPWIRRLSGAKRSIRNLSVCRPIWRSRSTAFSTMW